MAIVYCCKMYIFMNSNLAVASYTEKLFRFTHYMRESVTVYGGGTWE